MTRSVYRRLSRIELLSLRQRNCRLNPRGRQDLGAPGGTRTHDLAVVIDLLCPTELPGRNWMLLMKLTARQ